MDFSKLDGIKFNPKKPGSVNYAIARNAIEADASNRAEKRTCKNEVIKFLNGTVLPKPKKIPMGDGQFKLIHSVSFPDGSIARM